MAYTLSELRRKRDKAEEHLAEVKLRAEREVSPPRRQDLNADARYHEQKIEECTLMIRAQLAEQAHNLLKAQQNASLATAWASGYEAGRRDGCQETHEGFAPTRENPYRRR